MSSVNAFSGAYGNSDWQLTSQEFNSLRDFGKFPDELSGNQPTFATRSVDLLANQTSSFSSNNGLFGATYNEPTDVLSRASGGAKRYAARRVDRYLPTTPEGFDHFYAKLEQYVPGFKNIPDEMRDNWKRTLVDSNKGRRFFAEVAEKYKTVQSLYTFADEAVEHAPELMKDIKAARVLAENTGNFQSLKDSLGKMGEKTRCINIEYDLFNFAKPSELALKATNEGKNAALKELFNAQRVAKGFQGQWAAASGDNAFAKTGDILKQLHRNELYKVLNPLKEGRLLEGTARGLGWGLLAFSWGKNTINAYRAARAEGDGVGKSLWKSVKMFAGQGIKLLTCWQMFNVGFEIGAGLYAIFGAGAAAGAALSLPALACAIVGGAVVSAVTHAVMSKFFPDAPKIYE